MVHSCMHRLFDQIVHSLCKIEQVACHEARPPKTHTPIIIFNYPRSVCVFRTGTTDADPPFFFPDICATKIVILESYRTNSSCTS